GVVIVATQLLTEPLDLLAIPFGYAAGVIAKDVILAVFLAPRVLRIGSVSSPSWPASGRRRCTGRRVPGTDPRGASTSGSCGSSRRCSGRSQAGPRDPRCSRRPGTTGR